MSDREELKVELRRYLGGVPFSHVRTITREERKALWKEVVPYAALTSIFAILFLIVLFGTAVPQSAGAFFVLFAALFALVPGYCLYWAWPHLRTLRSGEVFVYIGQMQDVNRFDVVQDHYRRTYEMQSHLNRYIEILATGSGDRIWRLEGLPNDGSLRGVGSIQLALIPDHDERGSRPLTSEEREELRVRASGFLQIRGFVVRNLVGLLISLQVWRFGAQLMPSLGQGGLLPIVLMLLATAIVWGPYVKRWKFARMLKRDAKAGTVQDGTLDSGLPWVVRGEPARWRLGTAKGGTNGVSKEAALAFEHEYYAQDTSDGKEEDELTRAALAADENRVL